MSASETYGQPGRAAPETVIERADDAGDRRTATAAQGADVVEEGGMMHDCGHPLSWHAPDVGCCYIVKGEWCVCAFGGAA